MKKIVKISTLSLLCVLAFVSCSKENESGLIPLSKKQKITFTAGQSDTKTIFGDKTDGKYPILWTANQQVAISYNLGAFQNVDVQNISEDKKTASFTATIEPDTSEGATHTFYAVSPAYTTQITADGKISYTIPFAQMPLFENSVDEHAQLLVAHQSVNELSNAIGLDFFHILAYGKITVILPEERGNVYSLAITVSDNNGKAIQITGDVLIDLSTFKVSENYNNDYNKIVHITNKFGTNSLFFSVLPIGDLMNKSLYIEVETTKGSGKLTKTINFTQPNQLAFNAGQVSEFTVNFTK